MPDYSYDGIMKSFEHSLVRLGLASVDVLLLRDADVWGYGHERAEELYPIALERQAGVMLGGVHNSGILATGAKDGVKYNYLPAPPEILEKVSKIEKVCAAHGVSLPVAAIHFCLGHPAVSPLVGPQDGRPVAERRAGSWLRCAGRLH